MLSQDWPIESITPNEGNPRSFIPDNDPTFAGLVASIKSQGIIQPLLIDKHGLILAGHRRYAAALELGLERVPVRIISEKNNHSLIPLIENLQRCDLSVMEVADYLVKCRKEHGMTIAAIAEITGISEGTIQKYLKLAEGPMEIRERINRDDITLGAAFALLGQDEDFIREIIKEPYLTRQMVRERVKEATRRASRVQPDKTYLTRIWTRLEDGCYTVEDIRTCLECGRDIFPKLDDDEIRGYLDELVQSGKAEWRKQGGKKEMSAGQQITLCVPADLPTGAIDFGDRDKLASGNLFEN